MAKKKAAPRKETITGYRKRHIVPATNRINLTEATRVWCFENRTNHQGLADKIGMSSQHLSITLKRWDRGTSARLPIELAVPLSRLLKIPFEKLRPDLHALGVRLVKV